MPLSNFENITVAQCLEGAKEKWCQDYFQPGIVFGFGAFNYGPSFRTWQRSYDSMIFDLMDKATTGDAIALGILTRNLGRVYIRNADAVTRNFFVDGYPRSIDPGKVWCLHKSVADLVQLQASQLGFNIPITTDADYAANGLLETFGD